MRRFGGGPSERARIASVGTDVMAEGFLGEEVPETLALEAGVGYRLAASMLDCSGEGGDGDWERTERGEDGGDEAGSEGGRVEDEDGGGSILTRLLADTGSRDSDRDSREARVPRRRKGAMRGPESLYHGSRRRAGGSGCAVVKTRDRDRGGFVQGEWSSALATGASRD